LYGGLASALVSLTSQSDHISRVFLSQAQRYRVSLVVSSCPPVPQPASLTQSIMTALRESAAIVTNTTDDTNHKKVQQRTVLPSNSPSSAYSSREKRRHTSPCTECQQDQQQVHCLAVYLMICAVLLIYSTL